MAVAEEVDKYEEDMEKLIDTGKEKGYLTFGEVNDLLPGDITSPDELDDLMTTINTQGIDVLSGEGRADRAEAQVLVRLVGDSAPLRAALIEACGDQAEVDFTLEIPFVRLRAVEGLPTMIAKFTTDIPQLSNWGEPLLLGPGSIHVAHTPFEKLAKKELLEAVDLYIQVAKKLLS